MDMFPSLLAETLEKLNTNIEENVISRVRATGNFHLDEKQVNKFLEKNQVLMVVQAHYGHFDILCQRRINQKPEKKIFSFGQEDFDAVDKEEHREYFDDGHIEKNIALAELQDKIIQERYINQNEQTVGEEIQSNDFLLRNLPFYASWKKKLDKCYIGRVESLDATYGQKIFFAVLLENLQNKTTIFSHI